MGFRVWSWKHGGNVLCGKTGPHLPAVVLASSRVAAGAGTGGSSLRYVWRRGRRSDYYLFYPHAHTHSISLSLICFLVLII